VQREKRQQPLALFFLVIKVWLPGGHAEWYV
jgi:hypothetical protein